MLLIFIWMLPLIMIVFDINPLTYSVGDYLGMIGIILSLLFSIGGKDIFKKLLHYFIYSGFSKFITIELIFNLSFEELDWFDWYVFKNFEEYQLETYIVDNEILSPHIFILKDDPSGHLSILMSLCSKGYLWKHDDINGTVFMITKKTTRLIDPSKTYHGNFASINHVIATGTVNWPKIKTGPIIKI